MANYTRMQVLDLLAAMNFASHEARKLRDIMVIYIEGELTDKQRKERAGIAQARAQAMAVSAMVPVPAMQVAGTVGIPGGAMPGPMRVGSGMVTHRAAQVPLGQQLPVQGAGPQGIVTNAQGEVIAGAFQHGGNTVVIRPPPGVNPSQVVVTEPPRPPVIQASEADTSARFALLDLDGRQRTPEEAVAELVNSKDTTELLALAENAGIEGADRMTKPQLANAIIDALATSEASDNDNDNDQE